MADLEDKIQKKYKIDIREVNLFKLYKLKDNNITDEELEKAFENARKRWNISVNGANEANAKRDRERLENADKYEEILRNKSLRKELFAYYYKEQSGVDLSFARSFFRLISKTGKIRQEDIDFFFAYYQDERKNKKDILEMLRTEFKIVYSGKDKSEDNPKEGEQEKKKKNTVVNHFSQRTLLLIHKCEAYIEKIAALEKIKNQYPEVSKGLTEFLHIQEYEDLQRYKTYIEQMSQEAVKLRYEKGQEYISLVDLYNTMEVLLQAEDVVWNFTEFKILIKYPKLTPYMYEIRELKEKSLKEFYEISKKEYDFIDLQDFLVTYFIPIYDNFGIYDIHIKQILKKAKKQTVANKTKKSFFKIAQKLGLRKTEGVPLGIKLLFYIMYGPQYLLFGLHLVLKFIVKQIRKFAVISMIPLGYMYFEMLGFHIDELGSFSWSSLVMECVSQDALMNSISFIIGSVLTILIIVTVFIMPFIIYGRFMWSMAVELWKRIDWDGKTRTFKLMFLQLKEKFFKEYVKNREAKKSRKTVKKACGAILINTFMIAICVILCMVIPKGWKMFLVYWNEHKEAILVVEDVKNITLSVEQYMDTEGMTEILPLSVSTSSELISSRGICYGAQNLIDGDTATSWQESAQGDGIFETIHMEFDNQSISYISVRLGNAKSEKDYQNNNRPSRIQILINGEKEYQAEFEDRNGEQYIVFSQPITVNSLEFKILEVYSGKKYQDTCVSEITIYKK